MARSKHPNKEIEAAGKPKSDDAKDEFDAE
jgi:hypothetical protein